MTDLILERFWNLVKVDPTSKCWNWQAHKNNRGYGYFKLNGKTLLAHRFSYEVNKGKILRKLELDHLCRNPACVNPDHLEAVTHKENLLRGNVKTSNWKRKMTHCSLNHELKEPNLNKCDLKRGKRRCKTCLNNKQRTRRQKTRGLKLVISC